MTTQDKLPLPDDNEVAKEASADLLSDPALLSDEFSLSPEDTHFELPPFDMEAAVEFLRYLREDDDPEEQRETMEYLIRVLDEDRPSYRKLFPEEMKGITW